MFFRFCISITNVKHAILLLTIIIISGQMPLEIGITRFIFFCNWAKSFGLLDKIECRNVRRYLRLTNIIWSFAPRNRTLRDSLSSA